MERIKRAERVKKIKKGLEGFKVPIGMNKIS